MDRTHDKGQKNKIDTSNNRMATTGWNKKKREKAHPQEIADSHIHQDVRSVKTTDTISLSGPLSCNDQRATKSSLKQPQTTTNGHACQMSQTNHHQHHPNSYRQASNNGDL
ncbi:hypothetical protein EVAR_57085_1 [Eumeta japonica]|uniref:Uncharacterized protein n=1 Tax=Eumeta variegata TaxID=151549 RepID=A0A4C1ZAR7_EUMVA|nr:hypothetical protein EVAR_57085_1 [Eumeta japonica]